MRDGTQLGARAVNVAGRFDPFFFPANFGSFVSKFYLLSVDGVVGVKIKKKEGGKEGIMRTTHSLLQRSNRASTSVL